MHRFLVFLQEHIGKKYGTGLMNSTQKASHMLHVGDITKLDGALLPPVDIICGGSPCQDLSVAGARAGLAGERSGLFMEQIRVIKEMRDADRKRGRTGNAVRPRFGCWENVPGAFSSATGDDFQAVLEEFLHVEEPHLHVTERIPFCTEPATKRVRQGEIATNR
ncbi:MAG: DNA cytosine methyltransferase [Oscillospiraceae bacterium]|nr:DNA cytosine methyltransferase [Oscillospiraceae bacterium]